MHLSLMFSERMLVNEMDDNCTRTSSGLKYGTFIENF